MSKIIIIGGSGFIGTRLGFRLEKSQKDFSVVDKAISQSFGAKSAIADVRFIDTLRSSLEFGTTIVNLAAEHKDDIRPKSLYDEVNVQGAENVCKIAEEKGINRIIFTSTVAVYGFAPPNTDELGQLNWFNDYGRTKAAAEEVYRNWQMKDSKKRSLVIIRPTVVFGEQNRGNVYNLLNQIYSDRFVMVGDGKNRKSMAYVENVAAFIEYMLEAEAGLHIYNYVDKPDYDMNTLVQQVRIKLGKKKRLIRIPFLAGYCVGMVLDLLATVSGRSFSASAIRVKKFCSTTQFGTSVGSIGFIPPITLKEGLDKTVQHEFLENHEDEKLFFTE